jgi:hypothetical protein
MSDDEAAKKTARYERELVLLLRMRGQTEPEIAGAITELRGYAKKTGKAIEDEFGSPAEFASQFPVRNSPSTRGGAMRRLFGAAFKPSPNLPKEPTLPQDPTLRKDEALPENDA